MRLVSLVFLSFLIAGCADAALRREVGTLRTRVDLLEREREQERGIDDVDARLGRLEKYLDPYMNQPQAAPDPDPALTYAVPIAGDFFVGAADAPVTLVLAFDYACPYCNKVRATLAQLRQRYGADLRIVYKNMVVHPETATLPALAACAAGRQGRFADMDELLWTRGFEQGGYSRELALQLAGELGLDRKRFEGDLDGEACKELVAADGRQFAELGVSGTPSVYVNGRHLGGAQPVDAFAAVIDVELAKARERIAAGAPAATYYQTYVLDQGKSAL